MCELSDTVGYRLIYPIPHVCTTKVQWSAIYQRFFSFFFLLFRFLFSLRFNSLCCLDFPLSASWVCVALPLLCHFERSRLHESAKKTRIKLQSWLFPYIFLCCWTVLCILWTNHFGDKRKTHDVFRRFEDACVRVRILGKLRWGMVRIIFSTLLLLKCRLSRNLFCKTMNSFTGWPWRCLCPKTSWLEQRSLNAIPIFFLHRNVLFISVARWKTILIHPKALLIFFTTLSSSWWKKTRHFNFRCSNCYGYDRCR